MMAAAAATSTLRIGTLVHDNDYRHPLILAKESATIDLLSDGRLELGLGAGWMRSDYDASGMPYDPPGVRIDRFEEGIAVVKGLMADGPFSFEGKYFHHRMVNIWPRPYQQPHPPIWIASTSHQGVGMVGERGYTLGTFFVGHVEVCLGIVQFRLVTEKVFWDFTFGPFIAGGFLFHLGFDPLPRGRLLQCSHHRIDDLFMFHWFFSLG